MVSLSDLRQFKQQGRKFSCLTCYDASMAKVMEVAEIDGVTGYIDTDFDKKANTAKELLSGKIID